MLVAAILVFASGCATQTASYDYRVLAAGLGDYDPSIIDWNFPTPTNQGPLLPPERPRPTPAAIGVPWGYGYWLWWQSNSPDPADGTTAPQTGSAGEPAPATCAERCDAPAVTAPADVESVASARPDARLREPAGTR
jgi:hypothetical protein